MLIRIAGFVIAVTGVILYALHLAKFGSEPHMLWALASGALLVFGLWLALPGRRKKR